MLWWKPEISLSRTTTPVESLKVAKPSARSPEPGRPRIPSAAPSKVTSSIVTFSLPRAWRMNLKRP